MPLAQLLYWHAVWAKQPECVVLVVSDTCGELCKNLYQVISVKNETRFTTRNLATQN